MSFISGIGKIVTGGLKTIGGAALDILKGPKILDLARETLGFIPGFNLVPTALKTLESLTHGGDPAQRVNESYHLFKDLTQRHGIDDSIRMFPGAQEPPLGPLDNLLKGPMAKLADIIRNVALPVLENLSHGLKTARDILHGMGKTVGFLDKLLPGDWSKWTEGLKNLESGAGQWVTRIENFRTRLEDIARMLEEASGHSSQIPAPSPWPEVDPVIIR